MGGNFGYGLRDAVNGKPVDLGRIAENFHPEFRRSTDSANLKLGAIPAGGLDAFRRHDTPTVNAVLDWAAWLVTQPLHENEALNPLEPYRDLLDTGTFALALLSTLAGRDALTAQVLARSRASIAWQLLGCFTGPAKTLVRNNPQPPDRPYLLKADGPIYHVKGAPGMPWIEGVGMRGWVREPGSGGHVGALPGHSGFMEVMVAAALRREHDAFWWGSKKAEPTSVYQDIMRRAPGLLPWGLSDADAVVGRAFLAHPQDPVLAREIHSWTLACLPDLPFTYIQRESGAKEIVARHLHGSSTGGAAVKVCMADGTWYATSADDGQRGGPADAKFHHQPQDSIETPTEWVCRWTSGEGKEIRCPRPPASDPVAWRVDSDGEGHSAFRPPVVPPVNPKPKKENKWTGWL